MVFVIVELRPCLLQWWTSVRKGSTTVSRSAPAPLAPSRAAAGLVTTSTETSGPAQVSGHQRTDSIITLLHKHLITLSFHQIGKGLYVKTEPFHDFQENTSPEI